MKKSKKDEAAFDRRFLILHGDPAPGTKAEIHFLKSLACDALHALKAQKELFPYFRPAGRPPPELIRYAEFADRLLAENEELIHYKDLTGI